MYAEKKKENENLILTVVAPMKTWINCASIYASDNGIEQN